MNTESNTLKKTFIVKNGQTYPLKGWVWRQGSNQDPLF